MKKIFFLFIICMAIGYSDLFAEEVYALFPEVESWEKKMNHPVYTPADLWDYINGAADGYLSQEFVDLHIAEYIRGEDNIKVEIYRHMDPAHGYGIFTQERSADFNFIDVGARGYLEGTSLNFVNGKYYIKIFGSSEDEYIIKSMKKIAGELSENINPAPELPDDLKKFPDDGRLDHREAFISKNFLGHEFLNSAYTAKYEKGGEKFSLFIIEEMNDEAVEQILKEYFEFTKQPEGEISQGRLTIKDPYNGNLHVLWKGNTFYGIMGTDDKNIIDEYLSKVSQ